MAEIIKRVKIKAEVVSSNILFQRILVFIFSIPLIATFGQFIYSGFIYQNSSVSIIFWPGIQKEFAITMPVLISFGLMAISYIVGIAYIYKKRIFGKVVIWGVLGIVLAQSIGTVFNSITGLTEQQQINSAELNGVVNRAIFSLWHNPAWEEIVFRGIPLVMLFALKNKFSEKGHKLAIIAYFTIPSIAMVFYHIPNHGMSRIVDTIILSIIFAWLALRYSFFAPLILHYIFDTMMVLNLGIMKGINKSEVSWLSKNFGLINSFFTIGVLALIVSIPGILLWNARKTETFQRNRIKVYSLTLVIFLVLGFILFHFVH